jgi:aspartyl-tRNA(Asn)/glutamyl-tRNA(Gln) amidotransferase subunit C
MELQDLRETAALAHLNLDEAELSGAFPAFEELLGFFAAMQTAGGELQEGDDGPGAGISAVARTVSSGWFRGDAGNLPVAGDSPAGGESPGPGGDETVERMLESAGERDGRFVVVPNVL